jgi:hypothetical protein
MEKRVCFCFGTEAEEGSMLLSVRTTLVADTVLCPVVLTSPHSVAVGQLAVVFPRCSVLWGQRHRTVEVPGFATLHALT